MHLATIDLNGPMGNLILAVYVIGGITLFAVSLLPGRSALWRVGGAILGLGIAIWAAYVFLFGGWIVINFYVALLPFILAIKAIVDYFKNRNAKDEPQPGFAQAQGYPQGQPQPGQPYPPQGQPSPQGQPYPQQGQAYPQQPQQPGSYTPQA
jgi:hypothetical protein